MNAITIGTAPDPQLETRRAGHACYMRQRVLDALLREDVRGCVSKADVISPAALPPAMRRLEDTACAWFKVTHFADGLLWIPVNRASFLQEWRSAGSPPLWQEGGRLRELFAVEDIVMVFGRGLPPDAMALFEAFADECSVAQIHREASEAERERWFAQLRTSEAELSHWHERLLQYDRFGAFLDHPLYPTARAKLGFDQQALEAYGPEFQRSFSLHWLAVPHAIHHPGIPGCQGWPAAWPRFTDVGLPASMSHTHALVPVHPFVWERELDAFLRESGLADKVMRAPDTFLTVAPTLSVRTVVLLDAPEWHLKLPLTIRTLGARNIRTIKPSTIADGHRIQQLLGEIAAREPSIGPRLLLTDEERGAHVDDRPLLGYILRRYPAAALRECTLMPVASLTAPSPSGKLVAEEVARQFYAGDLAAFLDDYLDLTLRLHLRLWLRYGIALESNQQNSIVVLGHGAPRLRLLLKDNDAARIHAGQLGRRWPDLPLHLAGLQDRRIIVDQQLPLAQMFTTITLQLNIAVLIERLAPILDRPVKELYAGLRQRIETILGELAAEGEDVVPARTALLDDERLCIKYLLVAATLAHKSESGAADVNKFYGHSAPNFLRPA